MRVFVTGATGFIGSAIVRELRGAGHAVTGLARSEAAARALAADRAEARIGDLRDTEALEIAAREADGVIHTGFIHDFNAYLASVETDRRAVAALASGLAGSGKPFVSTSVTPLVASGGRVAREQDVPPKGEGRGLRADAEEAVLAAASRGVRSSVIRLPASVHGAGDRGFVPRLIEIARAKGVSAHVGDGANRWPAVHRFDAARLYRLALERAGPGSRLHAVAEEGIALRDIAQTIGAGLGVPVRGVAQADAPAQFEWLAPFVAIDNPTSSAWTQETMGWRPEGPGLLEDMRAGYFV